MQGLETEQPKIQALYNEYKAEVGAYQDKIAGTGIDSAEDIKGDEYGFSQRYTKYVAEIQQKYTYRAQAIESSLSGAYWDGYKGVVGSTPGIFEGPTNAVAAPPGVFMDAPNMPGGVPGAVCGSPGVLGCSAHWRHPTRSRTAAGDRYGPEGMKRVKI